MNVRLHGALQGAGRLLKWCVENNVRANWDAANPESCKLAEKLGYIQKGEYRAHYLKAG